MEENHVQNALKVSCNFEQQFEKRTIQFIWKLREDYVPYRIFLWLENEGDVDVFTYLSFSGIMIYGFCNEHVNDMNSFLGKQIVDIASVIYDLDVIIVYGKEDSRKVELEKYMDMKALLLSCDKLFVIRGEMYEKAVVIVYDSVNEARRVEENLQTFGIKIAGYCSTMGSKPINAMKKNV